jgi:hypothetical protein
MISPLEITEISQGRDVDVGLIGERKYHRCFRVRYGQATSGPGQAMFDQFIRRYSVYAEPGGFVDEGALAITAAASPEDGENSYNWVVTVYYSSRWWLEVEQALHSGGTGKTGGSPGGPEQKPGDTSPANPLARPAKYSWGFATQREVMEFDFDPDNPKVVRNTAGCKFLPPYETERKLRTLTVERNVSEFLEPFATSYMDTVNQSDLRILGNLYDAGTVRLDHWTAESQLPENGISFWTERLFFVFKKGRLVPNFPNRPFYAAWKVVLENAGTKEMRNGKLTPIIRTAHPEGEPWPLDKNGKALDAPLDPLSVNYLTFTEFPAMNFDLLGIDED